MRSRSETGCPAAASFSARRATKVRIIPFWRLTDEERAAVRSCERDLASLLSRGWLAARQEELAARSRALFAPDGSPRCWWCASPARGDGSHLCDTCAVSRQVA